MGKASSYKAEKEAEKEELVKKVQQAQADIAQANNDLVNANKPTVAAVTAAFSVPTVQPSSAGTTAPGSTPPPTGSSPGAESTPPPTGSSPGATTPLPTTSMTTKSPIGKRLNKYRIFQ